MQGNASVVRLTVLLALYPVAVANVGISADEVAIRKIISEEVAAWNSGDATAYSRHFAPACTFTNIFGMVFNGHDGFEQRHAETFRTFFKGSNRREKIRKIHFVTRNVAVVDIDTEVKEFRNMPPGVTIQPDGVLRTRLQQVFVKRGGEWWIEAYHNVDVKVETGETLSNGTSHSDRDGDYEIYIITPAGTDLKRLTRSPGNDAHPSWSPDDKWIALPSTRSGHKDETL